MFLGYNSQFPQKQLLSRHPKSDGYKKHDNKADKNKQKIRYGGVTSKQKFSYSSLAKYFLFKPFSIRVNAFTFYCHRHCPFELISTNFKLNFF